MDLIGLTDPGLVPADAVTEFAFGTIRILGYGALGIVVFGLILSALCDLFECRKWRQAGGRTEIWRLMH
jgi:hypothetical protein